MSLILQRALEPVGDETGLDRVDVDGLSLVQIKEIAAEVGIDPHRIDVAAANLLEPSAVRPNAYAGIPTTVQFQTDIPGLEIGKVSHHDVLDLVRGVLGRQGIVSTDAGSVEWKARDPLGGRYVSLAPTEKGARLRVMGNFRDGLFLSLAALGTIGFGVTSAVVGGLGLGPAATFVGAAALALIPPRFVYRWFRKREDASLAAVHGKLVAFLNRASQADTSESLTPPPELPPGDPGLP